MGNRQMSPRDYIHSAASSKNAIFWSAVMGKHHIMHALGTSHQQPPSTSAQALTCTSPVLPPCPRNMLSAGFVSTALGCSWVTFSRYTRIEVR